MIKANSDSIAIKSCKATMLLLNPLKLSEPRWQDFYHCHYFQTCQLSHQFLHWVNDYLVKKKTTFVFSQNQLFMPYNNLSHSTILIMPSSKYAIYNLQLGKDLSERCHTAFFSYLQI